MKYVRVAAILFILTLLCGGFGEGYVPSQLIASGDAATTARNLREHAMLFRFGFASYLVEAFCDIGIALIFYFWLRHVREGLALLTAFLGLISTALYAVSEMFFYGAFMVANGGDYLQSFSPAQIDSLTLLSIKYFSYCSTLFIGFYGIGWIIRAYLMWRSNVFPKAIAVLMGIGGAGFLLRNVAYVLLPQVPSGWLLAVIFPGILVTTGWLLKRSIA